MEFSRAGNRSARARGLWRAAALAGAALAGGCGWPFFEIVVDEESPARAASPASVAAAATDPAGRRLANVTLEELQRQLPTSEPYRINAGDIVEVIVWNQPQFQKEVQVRPDGRLAFPYVRGEILAAGQTFAELGAELAAALGEFFADPQVSVLAVRLQPARVTILGQVRSPGALEMVPGDRVLDLLGKAGGLLQVNYETGAGLNGVGSLGQVHTADLDAAYISRAGEILPVDFRRLIEGSDFRQNIPLHDGDFIYIPSIGTSKKNIYVFGPGRSAVVPLSGETALVEVMALTVGWETRADNLNILIVRRTGQGPMSTIVNFTRIVTGRDPDFALQGGDIVLVPRTTLTTIEEFAQQFGTILGAVLSAGNVDDAFAD